MRGRRGGYRLAVRAGGAEETFTARAGRQRRRPRGRHGGRPRGDRRRRRRLPAALLQGQLLLGGPAQRGLVSAARLSGARPVSLGVHAVLGARRPAALRPGRRVPRTAGGLPRRPGEARRASPRPRAGSSPPSPRRTSPRHERHPAQAPGPRRASATSWSPRRARRGLPGFVNLIGMDSPGLTSAPAIRGTWSAERLLEG